MHSIVYHVQMQLRSERESLFIYLFIKPDQGRIYLIKNAVKKKKKVILWTIIAS